MPELPAAREERFAALGLSADSARQLAWDAELGDVFEAALAADGAEAQPLANWLTNEPQAREVDPAELAGLVVLVSRRAVTPGNARVVLGLLADGERDPEKIVAERGLGTLGDEDELAGVVDAALAANADAAEKIRAGNMKAIGPIIGHVMRETKGRADGGEVTRLVRAKLGVG